MLLYIHVPFCRRKCPYCAFYSVPFAGREEALALWRSALGAEMRHYAGALPGRRVESIFFGGGTPSLIPPAMLEGILDDCARLFALEDGIEVSSNNQPRW